MQNLCVKISTSQVYPMVVIIITGHKEGSCKPKVTSSQKDIASTPKQREMAYSLNASMNQNNTTITSKCSRKKRKEKCYLAQCSARRQCTVKIVHDRPSDIGTIYTLRAEHNSRRCTHMCCFPAATH